MPVGGLILFIIGMNASDSAADRWSDFFTGHFTDNTVWYLVELNNQFYSNTQITLSIGTATSAPGERLEDVAKRADAEMYKAKREYYLAEERQRALSAA